MTGCFLVYKCLEDFFYYHLGIFMNISIHCIYIYIYHLLSKSMKVINVFFLFIFYFMIVKIFNSCIKIHENVRYYLLFKIHVKVDIPHRGENLKNNFYLTA